MLRLWRARKDLATTRNRISGLSILFQLDPRITGVIYGARWVSGPNFTSAVQRGAIGTVDVKVRGLDARGRPVPLASAEWISTDPGLITVAPIATESGRGDIYRITVTAPGTGTLTVGARGASLTLSVTARDLGNAVRVKIEECTASADAVSATPAASLTG